MGRLSKHRGAISVFLLIVFMISYVFMGLLTDAGRYQIAQTYVESALDSATTSIMSSYDKLMFDLYGLFSVDMGATSEKELEKAIEEKYRTYIDETLGLVEGDTSQYKTLLNELLSGESEKSYYNTKTLYDFELNFFESGTNLTLASAVNVENQIIDHMKFRAPVELMEDMSGFLGKMNEIINMKEKVDDAVEKEELKEKYENPPEGTPPLSKQAADLVKDIDDFRKKLGGYVTSPGETLTTTVDESQWKAYDIKDYLKQYDTELMNAHKKYYENLSYYMKDYMWSVLDEAWKILEEKMEDEQYVNKRKEIIPELFTYNLYTWDQLRSVWAMSWEYYNTYSEEIKKAQENKQNPEEVVPKYAVKKEFLDAFQRCMDGMYFQGKSLWYEPKGYIETNCKVKTKNLLSKVVSNASALYSEAENLLKRIDQVSAQYDKMIKEMEEKAGSDSEKQALYSGDISSAKASIGKLLTSSQLLIKSKLYLGNMRDGVKVSENQTQKLTDSLFEMIDRNSTYHMENYYCTLKEKHTPGGDGCNALGHQTYYFITGDVLGAFDPKGEESCLKDIQAGACLYRFIYIEDIPEAQAGDFTWDDYNKVSSDVYGYKEIKMIKDSRDGIKNFISCTNKVISDLLNMLKESEVEVQEKPKAEVNTNDDIKTTEKKPQGTGEQNTGEQNTGETKPEKQKFSGKLDNEKVVKHSDILFVNDRAEQESEPAVVASATVEEEVSLGTMKRLLKIGQSLISGLGDLLESARDNLYIDAYVMTTFPNYKDHYKLHDENKDCYIFVDGREAYLASYAEVEYIVTGAADTYSGDKLTGIAGNFGQKSIEGMRTRLFGTRLLFNAMSMLTDSAKISQASSLSAWAGFFAPLVTVVLLICWVVAETVIDVMVLMGDIETDIKIPVFKKPYEWLFSGSGLAKLAADKVIDKAVETVCDQVNQLVGTVESKADEMIYEAYKQINDGIDGTVKPIDDIVNGMLDVGEQKYGEFTQDIKDKANGMTEGNISGQIDKVANTVDDKVNSAFSEARNPVSRSEIVQEAKKFTSDAKEQAILTVSKVSQQVSSKVTDATKNLGEDAKKAFNDMMEKYTPKEAIAAGGQKASITMDYNDYLYFFLFITSNTKKVQRIQSVIQANMNVALAEDKMNYRLKNVPVAVWADAEVSMKYMFLSNGIVPDSMKRNGRLRFRVISSRCY